jgi:hypothetical protein
MDKNFQTAFAKKDMTGQDVSTIIDKVLTQPVTPAFPTVTIPNSVTQFPVTSMPVVPKPMDAKPPVASVFDSVYDPMIGISTEMAAKIKVGSKITALNLTNFI